MAKKVADCGGIKKLPFPPMIKEEKKPTKKTKKTKKKEE